jgi:hypothetical protein
MNDGATRFEQVTVTFLYIIDRPVFYLKRHFGNSILSSLSGGIYVDRPKRKR